MYLDRLFKLMADKQASDLFISCGAPINMKVSGIVAPISTQPMDVDGPAVDDDAVDPDILAARRLTKTLLDQAHLSPFPISTRPVHWDYASALQLYPLPSALVIADPEAPLFALNYMGCCVMNPGRLVDGRKGARARWIEFDVIAKKGEVIVDGT